MSDQGRSVVRLYSRPGCHLCDETRSDLAALAKEGFQFDVTEINIETDDELHRDYLERLPVVEIDGREIGELEIPRAVLATELELAASMPPHDSNG